MPKPAKRFAKIYVEITNVCNLNCSFCHGTRRERAYISTDDLATYVKKAAPFTDHVYLHVMGEPLLHRQLGEIIDIAAAEGVRVSITTNGTLIKERLPLLLEKADKLYKISISLHSFEANAGIDAKRYVDECAEAAKALGNVGVISVLRLWNLEGDALTAAQNSENADIIDRLKIYFPCEWRENRSGKKIGENVYLEWGECFDWPDASGRLYGANGFCYALKDHVAVLCDGSVVPCCLDADGVMVLGNLKTETLDEIMESEPVKRMLEGFAANRLERPLCRRCGFARRFIK